MKSFLIQKKTWLLVALLMTTTSCTIATCRVGNKIIYIYDYDLVTDTFVYDVYDVENSFTGALSVYQAPFGTASGVDAGSGIPALGITSYHSNANVRSQGIYFFTQNSLNWIDGSSQETLGSVTTPQTLRDFQIAPNGNFALGTDGTTGNVYNYGLNPLQLNYTYSLGSSSVLNRIAISPDSSRAIITDLKLGQYYDFNPAMKTYETSTIPGTTLGRPAFSRDGFSYAIPAFGSNSVFMYDSLTDMPITTITGIPNPTELIPNRRGTEWYVLSSPVTGNGSVYWFDSKKFSIGGNLGVGPGPMGLSWSPGFTTLYTANSGNGTLSAIDTVGMPSISKTVTVGTNPVGVALFPLSTVYTF